MQVSLRRLRRLIDLLRALLQSRMTPPQVTACIGEYWRSLGRERRELNSESVTKFLHLQVFQVLLRL